MKKWLVFFLYFTVVVVCAQKSVPRLTERADELYDNSQYLEALAYYEKISGIAKKDYRAKYRLGMCQLKTLQYEEAEETFARLGQTTDPANEFRSQSLYNYATILKTNNQFEEADSLFQSVITISDDPEILKLSRRQKEGCLLAIRQLERDRGFSISPLEDVNSKLHDFGAILNPGNSQLVFATTRNLSGTQYEGRQFEGVLPDLASFAYSRNRWKNNSNEQRFSRLNSEWSEGSGTFTRDGQAFYFSSCKGDTGSDCAIMVSYLDDEGNWGTPQPLNEYINEAGSENKQPSITASGDTLFFSSDRSGGYGGSDIWMSLRGSEQDSWSPAINMGGAINTPENDITPYYSSAYECLIFASNGHIGYGGYDLFAAKGESFFEPQLYNLGTPFNSSLDDTYFNVSDTLGFISSNRENRRILNIYSFKVTDERLFLSLLISGESLIDSRIISRFKDVSSLDLFAFRVEDYQGYELFDPEKRVKPKPSIISAAENAGKNQPSATAGNYLDENSSIEQSYYGTGAILGKSGYSVDYEHVYFSFGSSQLQPVVKKSLEDLASQLQTIDVQSVEILAYTDIRGDASFNQKLSEARGKAVADYLASLGVPKEKIVIRARGEGPLSSRNSWYSRMFSRRAEIIVNGNRPISMKTARPYAVRYESTVATVEQQLQLKPGQLKQWNDLASDTLPAGSVIRLGELTIIPPIKYFLEEADLRNSFFVYKVQPNETLASIAHKFNTLEEVLMEVNQMGSKVKPGEEIFIYQVK